MTRFDPVDAGGLQIARRSRLRCLSANSPTAAKVARNWPTGSSGLGNNDGQVISQINFKELEMDIKKSGSQPSSTGPAEYSTGTVHVDS